MDVLYTAAHSGFDLTRVPLGGGAAICEHLTAEWKASKVFPLRLVGPAQFADSAAHADLVHLSERAYAVFCRRFERQTSELIAQQDPRQTVVLSNDVSEGPDFRRLALAGYRLYTIYHVDVVEYVSRMYLRGYVPPDALTKTYAALEKFSLTALVPDIFKLVVQKQNDSVHFSKGLIVPSAAMKAVLMRCYPRADPAKIHVLPWGIWDDPVDPVDVERERHELQRTFDLPTNAPILLTLSRISPEKGQDRLLKALALWEASADYPEQGAVLLIAGEPAYMQGRRYAKELRRLARRLRRTRVVFVGYAAGARKRALFNCAALYVFPSKHESYGLTLLEAMRAGLPALTCDDHGTRDLMRPDVGIILPPASEAEVPRLLKEALVQLFSDRVRLKAMGQAAQAWAGRQRFSETAARLAELLKSL